MFAFSRCRQRRDNAGREGMQKEESHLISSHLAPFGSWRVQLSKSIPELLRGHQTQHRQNPRSFLPPKEEQLAYIPAPGTAPSTAMTGPQPCWGGQWSGPGTVPGVTADTTALVSSGSELRQPSPRPSGTQWRQSSQG